MVRTIAATDAAFCSALLVTFGRVNDTSGQHIAIFFLVSIKAVTNLAGAEDLVDDDTAFQAGVQSDLTDRLFQCFQNNAE